MEFLLVASLGGLEIPGNLSLNLVNSMNFLIGSGNSEVKMGSEKFKEACSERMAYWRIFRNCYLGRYDCIGLDLPDPKKSQL
jgi:hypothetical protein